MLALVLPISFELEQHREFTDTPKYAVMCGL